MSQNSHPPHQSSSHRAATNEGRIKAIYDTDPGVDDAIALYFALAHPKIDLLGITTTFGNVSVEQAATNALYLTALAGRSVPVTRGVHQPLVKSGESPPAHIHGADGLGNLPARIDLPGELDGRSSAQFIVDMAHAHPGEVSLVAVGPLGNLALALQLEPELPKLLHQVVLMGGSVVEPGNVSPVAEANIWNDPHAADKVFTAGWKLTMVGLDVTHKVVTEVPLFERIARHHKHRATDTLLHAVEFYSHFYTRLHTHMSQAPGCYAHDLLAFIYLVQPDLFEVESGAVRVATEGLAQGQTILNRRSYIPYPHPGWESHRPNTQACVRVDTAGCLKLFEDVMFLPWLSNKVERTPR